MAASKTSTLDIRNFTRRNPAPGVPFNDIAKAVLPGWEISLVFAGARRAQQLNVALRNKGYIPNVLSYETTPDGVFAAGKRTRGVSRTGEIIICPEIAKEQAPDYEMPYKAFVAYLFIHGLLHLKGHPHGATMERHERALMTRFGFNIPSSSSPRNGTTHRNRH